MALGLGLVLSGRQASGSGRRAEALAEAPSALRESQGGQDRQNGVGEQRRARAWAPRPISHLYQLLHLDGGLRRPTSSSGWCGAGCRVPGGRRGRRSQLPPHRLLSFPGCSECLPAPASAHRAAGPRTGARTGPGGSLKGGEGGGTSSLPCRRPAPTQQTLDTPRQLAGLLRLSHSNWKGVV